VAHVLNLLQKEQEEGEEEEGEEEEGEEEALPG
jgi:hypothetical protein